MPTLHRLPITGALIVCLVGAPWNSTVFASDGQVSPGDAPLSPTMATSEERPTTSPALTTPIAHEDWTATATVSTMRAALERSRFTFTNDVFTATAPIDSVELSNGGFHFMPTPDSAFSSQVYRGRPRPIRNNRDGSIAAIVIGAVASITGAAILVYANRPECSARPFATGCGYGTKVVGGAVLAGGVVGLTVGALTWR